MITYIDGDLFRSPARVLVNTVNTHGVMGKGIALQFKQIYPEMFREYRDYCENGIFRVGNLHLYKTSHKWVLNFATKQHWRKPSKVEYIADGLKAFVKQYARMGVTSVAFPALGCGNGGLDYEQQVKPLMEEYLNKVRIPVLIYPARSRMEPPENEDIINTIEWLRSEPASLPFDEVWRDVSALLEQRTDFHTSANSNPYSVRVQDNSPSITILSSGHVYRIGSEELLEFWQKLRDHGLIHRGIAPDHYRVSYLMPVFEQLPYVQRVLVSDSARRLKTKPAIGLQVVPIPSKDDQTEGTLFGSPIHAI